MDDQKRPLCLSDKCLQQNYKKNRLIRFTRYEPTSPPNFSDWTAQIPGHRIIIGQRNSRGLNFMPTLTQIRITYTYHEEKEETLNFFLSRFEKDLKAGNCHFGGKLSWADFILVGFIELLSLYLEQPIEKDYPTIVALISKIHSLPGVKEYIAKREPYTLDSVKRS